VSRRGCPNNRVLYDAMSCQEASHNSLGPGVDKLVSFLAILLIDYIEQILDAIFSSFEDLSSLRVHPSESHGLPVIIRSIVATDTDSIRSEPPSFDCAQVFNARFEADFEAVGTADACLQLGWESSTYQRGSCGRSTTRKS